MHNITILGAGLVGSAMSILLRKKGYEVTIFEKRSDMRKDTTDGGRSINLALSKRGWKTIEYAGIKDKIEEIALPMFGRYLHQEDGSSDFQPYGKNNEAIYSVSRGELNKRLMDKAEEIGVKIYFNHRCEKVDIHQNVIYLTDEQGQEKKETCEFIFGADGAFSALRAAYVHRDRVNYNQFYLHSGYKELSIPPGTKENKWLIENNGLHIWPRHKFMMIALPNTDGSFTCTLFSPFEGENSFANLTSDEEIVAFFKKQFPSAFPLLANLKEDYQNNPTSSLITIKISSWVYKNQSCLIGDAAHAVVPFYGQGLNAGLEDCSIFYDLMEKYGEDNWPQILADYQELRKPNGDAIADLSLLNFIEMQDEVADPKFLERKKMDKELGRRFPDLFNSVYEMVAFSHQPYTLALHATRTQDALLKELQDKGGFFESLNNPEYLQWLSQRLEKYKEDILYHA